MSGVGQRGAASVAYIGDHPDISGKSAFNFSTPAGWTMFYWGLSVLIILVMFMML
jgi:hypothetical protein